MPKKLTQEYVASQFEAEGYVLLSKYRNAQLKLQFICPQGHVHSIRWGCWKQGKRCGYCSGRYISNEYVASQFESEGYILISEYKNSKTPLKFICPQGHRHSIPWSSWQQGSRCAYCVGNIVLSEHIKNSFEEEGYTLLCEYKNAKTKMQFKCPRGHYHKITWDAWVAGNRCYYCRKEDLAGVYSEKYFIKNPDHKERKASVYYFNFVIEGITYSKIGITTNWERRSRELPTPLNLRLINTTLYKAFQIEQRFLKKYDSFKCINNGIKLDLLGYTECFIMKDPS
jgi:hypothetical protein